MRIFVIRDVCKSLLFYADYPFLHSGHKLAYFVRVADTVSNMRSLVGVLREHRSFVWSKFNTAKANKINYYRVILQDMRDFLPAEVLEEYVGLLKDLEYSEHFEKNGLGFATAEKE
jgi:hypothetical protein